MSQVELAARLGVSRTTINLRESGKAQIGREAALALHQLAGQMGYSISYQHRTERAQNRNDACACGSGRKFKRCCGA